MKISEDIGIDLGTTNTIIYIKGKSIVVNEPTIVAIDKQSHKIIEYGIKAKEIEGRNPDWVEIVEPLKDGVISDFKATECLIKWYVSKIIEKNIMNPRVVICVPSGVTEVEKKAVLDLAASLGARSISIIQEPLAAAIGVGINITVPSGNMIVDIGGGTTDVAVISLGGIVNSASIKVAGNSLDNEIIKYIKKQYGIIISKITAEKVKIEIGGASNRPNILKMAVQGKRITDNMIEEIYVTSDEIYHALELEALNIAEAVKQVLENTTPELAADIKEHGIYLTGAASQLYGMDKLIHSKTNVDVIVANKPELCVALGTGKALDYITLLDNGSGSLK